MDGTFCQLQKHLRLNPSWDAGALRIRRREPDGSSRGIQAGYNRRGLLLQKHIKVGVNCTTSAFPLAPAVTLTSRRFSATLSDFERTSRHHFYELHCRGCYNSF